jgi:FkbM family methyltransferase
MFNSVTQKLRHAKRQSMRMAGVMVEHSCGRFVIQLPADHDLPTYQKNHQQYDRFLPVLVRRIFSPGTVIDVGANVGDTLAFMIDANTQLAYVCVEPDLEFFGLLQKNIERILAVCSGAKIETINSLAGKSVQNVGLVGSAGTKHAVVGAGTQASVTIDEMLRDRNLPTVRLLKSDVDGFDFDVLNSAEGLLQSARPILFFECQYLLDFQRDEYMATIEKLHDLGYANWCVFDNFGALMVQTADISVIRQLIDYVWRQNFGKSTRTIHYFDLLAWVSEDDQVVSAAISDYQAKF